MIQIHGSKFSVTREGLFRWTVQFYLDSQAEISDIPSEYDGAQLEEITGDQAEEGVQFVATAIYEKYAGDNFSRPIYGFDGQMDQSDIRLHPEISSLLSEYGGSVQDGEVIWPEELPVQTKGIKPSWQKGQKQSNPAFGLSSYLDFGGIWTESRCVPEIPASVFSEIGRVVDSVPGNLPEPVKRFWLQLAPGIEQRGNCWRIVRRWRLSGRVTEGSMALARKIYREI